MFCFWSVLVVAGGDAGFHLKPLLERIVWPGLI